MEFAAGALIGVFIGFLCGYGVRELISLRRHAAAERRRRARRGPYMILEIPRDAERRRGDGLKRRRAPSLPSPACGEGREGAAQPRAARSGSSFTASAPAPSPTASTRED